MIRRLRSLLRAGLGCKQLFRRKCDAYVVRRPRLGRIERNEFQGGRAVCGDDFLPQKITFYLKVLYLF